MQLDEVSIKIRCGGGAFIAYAHWVYGKFSRGDIYQLPNCQQGVRGQLQSSTNTFTLSAPQLRTLIQEEITAAVGTSPLLASQPPLASLSSPRNSSEFLLIVRAGYGVHAPGPGVYSR